MFTKRIIFNFELMLFRTFIICLFTLFIQSQIEAQRVIQPKLIEVDWKGIVYKNEWSIDIRLHENGAALAYNSGKIKSYRKTNYYQIELGFMKDPREKSQSKISQSGTSGSFAFGKINSLFNLRFGVGTKHYLSEKEKRKGLAVGYTYMIGPSLALLKPYYLDLEYVVVVDEERVTEIRSEKFSEQNRDIFLNEDFIRGRSSFYKGFDEINIRAGIHGKIGAHFAMGAFDKYVKAFETGVMFDLFTSEIPILLETESISNRPYFIKLYLNLQLGARNN